MKLVFTILFLLVNSVAKSAPLCEVYGISDSPQKLSCEFTKQKINLNCVDGVYYLNQQMVEVAFHMEVESGPTPLVFKTSQTELTVSMGRGSKHKATFSDSSRSFKGSCRL